ncbi:hypothetical protein FQA39_LY17695 [Lamprigera yunnana]|nr:hypothetical protein FQA39_LY17695 [Lamprigera yunnana]
MWMLYAEQHCTKAIDLKSAVERLFEKLGAMEFDADHEAIYGMEKYYTVKQCSEINTKLEGKLSYSSGSNFKHFYEDVIRAVAEISGDVKINIYNIVNRLCENSDDVCCMLEILFFMLEKALFDVQLERRIQEQGQKRVKNSRGNMWMLYAEQHCTKAIDLKSAVERLFEKLGAMEFDADHEAIYGMEKYYTVKQCSEINTKLEGKYVDNS